MKVSQETIQYVIEFLVGKELASCFAWNDSGWFDNPQMPDFPVREFEGMPVLFWAGDKPDFVASAYFLLSRYEELLNPARDEHGRFPGKASVPYKNHFLDRPIVDEYSRWLRNHLQNPVPNRTIEQPVLRSFSEGGSNNLPSVALAKEGRTISRLYLTHDVDYPFETRGLLGRFRDVASNLIRRHRFTLNPIIDYLLGRSNPDCFDWILDFDQSIHNQISQSSSVSKDSSSNRTIKQSNNRTMPHKSESIYFILARKDGDMRDNWYLTDRRWPGLLERFRKYGVTLGLHTSYAAGGDMSTVSTDVSTFRTIEQPVLRGFSEGGSNNQVLEGSSNRPIAQSPNQFEGSSNRTIEQSNNLSSVASAKEDRTILNRHHFLRMTDPSDFKYLESAGVTDDFSVGYADVAGFRVGTCHPYRWIDPRSGMVGKLVIHPMTIMECTLDGLEYMVLDRKSASAYCRKLIERVAVNGGECVLLWHNTSLVNSIQNWQRELYVQCLKFAMKWI